MRCDNFHVGPIHHHIHKPNILRAHTNTLAHRTAHLTYLVKIGVTYVSFVETKETKTTRK